MLLGVMLRVYVVPYNNWCKPEIPACTKLVCERSAGILGRILALEPLGVDLYVGLKSSAGLVHTNLV